MLQFVIGLNESFSQTSFPIAQPPSLSLMDSVIIRFSNYDYFNVPLQFQLLVGIPSLRRIYEKYDIQIKFIGQVCNGIKIKYNYSVITVWISKISLMLQA